MTVKLIFVVLISIFNTFSGKIRDNPHEFYAFIDDDKIWKVIVALCSVLVVY
jgi:Na+/citrate or Na+/malate symporter